MQKELNDEGLGDMKLGTGLEPIDIVNNRAALKSAKDIIATKEIEFNTATKEMSNMLGRLVHVHKDMESAR